MVALLACLLAMLPAPRAATGECASPRLAANSLLANLPPNGDDPAAAAACLDVPPEWEPRREELARQLKQVLDARDLYIHVDQLSDDPGWSSQEEGGKLVLRDELPEVFLVRRGDRWLYSSDSVRAIPRLYNETFSTVSRIARHFLPVGLATWSVLGLAIWQWLYLVVLLFSGTMIAMGAGLVLRGRLQHWLGRAELPFDTSIYDRTRGPLMVLAACLVVIWGVPDLQLGIKGTHRLLLVSKGIGGLAAVGIGLRWADVFGAVFRRLAERTDSRMDDQVVPLAVQATKLVVIALGLVFVLQNMGVDVGALVAGLGIGGVALAFASKDMLSNFFGSAMIFLDRPFQVGDWVILDGGVEGTIEEVGFRSTRVRTFYGSLVSVPNQAVANGRVDNMGARRLRRLKTTIGVTWDTPPDSIQAFVEGIRAILLASPHTSKDSFEVHFRDFGSSALEILLYAFLDVPDWHTELVARSNILMEILRLADDMGISFAFPSTSVYVESTPEHPKARRAAPPVPELREKVCAFGPGGARARPGGPVITGHGFNAGSSSKRGDSDEDG